MIHHNVDVGPQSPIDWDPRSPLMWFLSHPLMWSLGKLLNDESNVDSRLGVCPKATAIESLPCSIDRGTRRAAGAMAAFLTLSPLI